MLQVICGFLCLLNKRAGEGVVCLVSFCFECSCVPSLLVVLFESVDEDG